MFGLNSHGATPLNAISINNNSGQAFGQEVRGPNSFKFINCETGVGTLDTSYSSLVTTEQTFQQSTNTGGGDPTYNIQVFGNMYFEEPINNNNVINGIALNVGDYLYIDPVETSKFKNLQGTEIERIQITAVDNVNNRVQYFAYDYDFTGINTNGDGLITSGLGGVKIFTDAITQTIAPTSFIFTNLADKKASSLVQSLGLAQGTAVENNPGHWMGKHTYTINTETTLKIIFEQDIATGNTGYAEMLLTVPVGAGVEFFDEYNSSVSGEISIPGTITPGGIGTFQQISAWPPSSGIPDYAWFTTSIIRV
jgi:hypothetical protein